MKQYTFLFCLFLLSTSISNAQWSNHYPKVDGYGHHVYLEGYELPALNAGASDPAPSPDGKSVVFSAKGWLWMLNLNSDIAKRITTSPHLDFKPNWSPDGKQLVFIRDTKSDTKIILLELATNKETVLVDTEKLDLDPIFSNDGKQVFYASGKNGSIDLWQINLTTKEKNVITSARGLERLPVPTTNNELVYLKKRGFSDDAIELLNLTTGVSTALAQENFVSQASFTLAYDDKTLAYTWPNGDDYEIRLLDITIPRSTLLLTKSEGLPLTPKFSYDRQWVYYAESDKNERSTIKRISINGGKPETLTIKNWNWGIPTETIKITSTVDNKPNAVRMSITDASGHPIIPETGSIHFEGQNGIVFFYTPGETEVTVPLGDITITATHGFSTLSTSKKANVTKETKTAEINLTTLWDAKANGWYSADNHFHLNYGGTNQLDPEDIILDLKAENLDVGYPLLANLGQRFLEQDLWGWKNETAPLIYYGQETRSHFLGHLGLIGIKDIYWPWIWGPRYDIYGHDDRLNAEPMRFTREQGGLGAYVHPVSVKNPFTAKGARRVPIGLVADCVLEEVDLIELGCLWTDEIGTAAVWHEILNLGIPVAATAGSDVMNDLYHTMATGATRVYVKPNEKLTKDSYLNALKKGKSFVSNGPQLEFKVDGKEVGETITSNKKHVKWTLDVHSPVLYENVEIFVNGKVVWSKKTSNTKGNISYKGKVTIPDGGWITARVVGGIAEWPMMDSYPFAETSPIWFNKIGSTNAIAKKEAAQKLLDVLKVSEERLKDGYGDIPTPNLTAHFRKAKKKLTKIIGE